MFGNGIVNSNGVGAGIRGAGGRSGNAAKRLSFV
jgi:hypothetical protein